MSEENYKIGKYKRVLFYSVMFALLLAFLLGQHIYPSERDNVDEESLAYTGTFYLEKPDGSEEEITVPGQYDVPVRETMVIRTQLPQDYDESDLAFRASMENFEKYYNTYGKNDFLPSMSIRRCYTGKIKYKAF